MDVPHMERPEPSSSSAMTERRVRSFRGLLVIIVLIPWAAGFVLRALFGGSYSSAAVGVQLAVDGIILIFAWRWPGGIATWWLVVRIVSGAIFGFMHGLGAVWVASLVSLGAGVSLGVVVWVMRTELRSYRSSQRRDRREKRRQRAIARAHRVNQTEIRRGLKRQARIERDGYL